MASSSPDDVLSWPDLIYLADLVAASGEKSISLLGGEPTLHPDFVDMVGYLAARGFRQSVFTSGIMSKSVLNAADIALMRLPPEAFSFVCNINDPEKTETSTRELESVRRFLALFGNRTIASFNIYNTDFELDFLFQLINEFGLRRHIRLGIAHPIAGQTNRFIDLDEMRLVADRLMAYRPMFDCMRVTVGLDCGFLLCCFTDEELGWLHRHQRERNSFGCGPALDIGPDMQVWSCFPLAAFHKRSIFEFDSLEHARDFYREIHKKVRIEAGGVFEECDNCRPREDGTCAGGCIAHSLSRFAEEPRVRFDEVYIR